MPLPHLPADPATASSRHFSGILLPDHDRWPRQRASLEGELLLVLALGRHHARKFTHFVLLEPTAARGSPVFIPLLQGESGGSDWPHAVLAVSESLRD